MKLKTILALALPLLLTSCNPTLFDLQSAKMLGAGQLEFSAYTVGLNLGIGLTNNLDLNVSVTNDGDITDHLKLNVVTLAPKFNLYDNKAALYIPISRISAEDITFFQPTILFTNSLNRDIDFTVAPKCVITIDNFNRMNLMYGVSSNFSFHLPKTPLSIRTGFGGVLSQQVINNNRLFLDANIGLVFNMNQ